MQEYIKSLVIGFVTLRLSVENARNIESSDDLREQNGSDIDMMEADGPDSDIDEYPDSEQEHQMEED